MNCTGWIMQHTSDRSPAFAAVVDGGVGVLADDGAAVRAPAEPRLGAPGLHRRRLGSFLLTKRIKGGSGEIAKATLYWVQRFPEFVETFSNRFQFSLP
jgi:hypothetical protein